MGAYVISIDAPGSIEVDIVLDGRVARARIEARVPATPPQPPVKIEPPGEVVIVGPGTHTGLIAEGVSITAAPIFEGLPAEQSDLSGWHASDVDPAVLEFPLDGSAVSVFYLPKGDELSTNG
jgi:hypothetical protein